MRPRASLRPWPILLVLAASVQAAPAAAASCTVTPQSVNFGLYDSLSRAAVDGVGSVSVSCDSAVSFDISLGPGGSGTYASREMSGGQGDMRYNLYTSASRTTAWGDGSGGSTTVGGGGTGGDFTVYGRIDAGQNLPAGTYVDTVVVTITY